MGKSQYLTLFYPKNGFGVLFLLTLVFNLTFLSTRSQEVSETGLPYIQNYSPNEYGAFDQNWDAVQDSLGIMYFANGDGILTYDGANWGLLELPNQSTVFSLTISGTGRIYVGAIDEIGYLEPNTKGELVYVSLLPKIKKQFSGMGIIWDTHSTKDGVFFISDRYVFKWDGIKFDVKKNLGDHSLFLVHNILFKREKGKGLMKFENNRFELVSQGALFSDKRIYSILPYNEDFLVATKNQLFIFNGRGFTEFNTNAPQFFLDNTIYCGVALKDGTFALGSLNKGVLILDHKGEKKVVLSQKNILRSNTIYALFQDKSGLLWASLESGIAKIEYPSPFSFFKKDSNTPDLVFDIQRYQGKLFTGSSQGLFYLKNGNNEDNNNFEAGELDYEVTKDFLPFMDKMLIASITGIYEIGKKEKAKKILSIENNNVLYQSEIDANRVFIGTGLGMVSIYYKNDRWAVERLFKDVHDDVNKIVEGSEGQLWLGIDKNEVVRVSFDNLKDAQMIRNPIIRTFTPKEGLPNRVIKPYKIDNQIYFIAGSEVYKFDAQSEKFFKDKEIFEKLGLADKKVKINSVDEQGNIWLIEYGGEQRIEQIVAFYQNDGTYNVKRLNEQRIIDMRRYETYPEFKDSIIWYRGKPGIVRHDLKQKLNKNTLKSRVIIRDVLWQNDSLLFGGYKSSIVPELLFKNNQLRFQFASPSFYDESKNQFQYKLEGFDENWFSWTTETKKDYTNIPEGNFIFKVKAKNIFNEISEEDSYSFTVLPPWHRTWWAYLIYGLGAIALVSLIIKWRSRELHRKNENLENIVAERTTEIRHKNELLNHQTEQLEQLNESKTRLYSNITHEFRTPLTVILGMAETLKTNVLNKRFEGAEKSLEMIRRNGKNLLQLVNEMLDLAKVESGSMELNLVQTDAIPFVKYLSESFHSLAESKNINLTVYSEIDALEMDIDVNKMASIISNLLSNAIKFTRPNGKIIVHLNKIKTKDSEFLTIKMQDNGLGLAEDDIAHLFDRFYQVDNESSTKQEGTGIGLSLAKEFVELMKGTIKVESTLGKGSTFTVQIPVTNKAVKTVDAKITVEPPIKKTRPSSKTEPSFFDEASELPLALIIEDNEDVAHYLRTCLKGKYQTIHAINGIIGIEMAYEKIPDIIISDVMMPGKDGFEVCATLKSDERTDHIPVILLTAKVTAEDRLTGLSHGADAYLAKPFNEKELFIRLDQLVLLRKKLVDKIQKDGLNMLLDKRAESPETKFLQKVIQFINEDIGNSTFGSGDLADKLHLSESQIYRKLKAITNKSTAVFIRSIRLQKAKELIETTDKTISEIAYETGFNDPSWFSRAFKEEFGFAPSDSHK